MLCTVIVMFVMSPTFCLFWANIDIVQMSIFSKYDCFQKDYPSCVNFDENQDTADIWYTLKILVLEACHKLTNIIVRSVIKQTWRKRLHDVLLCWFDYKRYLGCKYKQLS